MKKWALAHFVQGFWMILFDCLWMVLFQEFVMVLCCRLLVVMLCCNIFLKKLQTHWIEIFEFSFAPNKNDCLIAKSQNHHDSSDFLCLVRRGFFFSAWSMSCYSWPSVSNFYPPSLPRTPAISLGSVKKTQEYHWVAHCLAFVNRSSNISAQWILFSLVILVFWK